VSDLSTHTDTTATGDYIRTLVSCTACWFLAQMSYYGQTQLFGPMMTRYERGETDVGIIFTQELTVFALTALIIAGPMSRISRVRAAVVGALLLTVVNLMSAYTDSFEVVRVLRIVAGFAGGLLSASGTASAASSHNPQRVFAIVGFTWGLIAAVQLAVLPYLTVPYGTEGGYYGMAAASVLLLPLLIWLNPPRDYEKLQESEIAALNLSFWGRIAEHLGVRDAPNARFAIVIMGGLFIYEIGQGATQVFLEQYGLRTGLDEITIGQILAISATLGLSGGALAVWVGDRFGNLKPVVIGVAFNAVFASTLALGTIPILFAASYLGWNMAYYFLVPLMLGLLAQMDDRGRWAVSADAVWWLGAAPGAAVAGALVEKGGYTLLATLAPITGFICILILIRTIRKFNATQGI
jgi:predicted MFS family arabinose efflux permease